ncbi:MAG: epoxyqueuosine reductase QueH [Firmicutes bacterium]|nr:epoxyqueuosine reductase QueH [Bacillota bacterium]
MKKNNLLLHVCCGPCSIYSWNKLEDNNYQVRGYFFNPNIHPYKEFARRLDALRLLAKQENRDIIVDERYLLEEHLRMVANRENERCPLCYRMRLEETARKAVDEGIDNISTTLLISPYQKHELLKKMGEEIAEKHGLHFVYEDFRVGFRESMRQAREKGLYMQGYCGCIYSEKDRYYKDKTRTKHKT